ncbi:V8-like Glu-specific endopeptidase [Clavibacter michiganensis]|uniref:trypsin-like serine peptidase n=1 Tax=Clavibacter michiganensis TaxID=28447 RepID=UPI001957D798|nr:serine protease [Clavibacter michiganensis]MBM7411129.1 V8-like Glu-specific endopeptidase [Clavibacter michiganensis]
MPSRPAPSARRPLAAVAALGLTTALLGVASAASADEPSAPVAVSASASASGTVALAVGANTPLVSVPVTSAEAMAAVAHWTPERRAAAIDADGADGSAPATGDPLAASAASTTSVAQPIAPVPHIGRFFFERDGRSYFCSANVVESANRSTIATAGHCVTEQQEFSSDMVFSPGYQDGESAYGVWPVTGGNVTTGWYQRNDQDQAEDTGFLTVGRDDDGADIQSLTGASPVRFDAQAAQQVAMYGYPGEGRFDGSELQRCAGTGDAYTAMQVDLACDMTGGVSGGPILLGDGSDGTQFGNVAERSNDGTHNIGPVWREAAQSAYELTAAAAR